MIWFIVLQIVFAFQIKKIDSNDENIRKEKLTIQNLETSISHVVDTVNKIVSLLRDVTSM